jgi:hypothetical protein
MTQEEARLQADRNHTAYWKRWGPYLSDRQWGTVREDYSSDGTAWEYLSHDRARSQAYRWGEDGIAGISDNHQRLCFAIALWNEQDTILKERFFGLTGNQGNHGEDVKEYYFYLDNTPTHSYMKCLYKYPQQAFPYTELVEENQRRDKHSPEFELIDTGAFDEDRYFDVFVEYAKQTPEDIAIQIHLSHDEQALRLIQGFADRLGKTNHRQKVFSAEGVIVRRPIDYQDVLARGAIGTDEDPFTLLQGDIVSTDAAYFLGERITDTKFAIASSTCDLIPSRRQYAALLRLQPIRADDPNFSNSSVNC